MNGTLQIAVDLEEGEVRLGSERVRLLPGRGDAFYLINRRGPMVRALRFEERSLLLNTNAANGDVAALIAGAAFVSSGECVDQVRVAVSLALAGGGEEAPSFTECARLVEESAGWNPEQVSGTMALVIDRLCGSMKQQESQNGWERIVFQEDEADLETLISRMAANLAQRAVPSAPVAKTEAETIAAAKQKAPVANTPAQTNHHEDWAVSGKSKLNPNSFSRQLSHRSVSSVSSVLPNNRDVKRIPARVLARSSLNTNQTNVILATPTPDHIKTAIESPASAQLNQANVSLTQTRSNPADISLTPTAPIVFEQPLMTSPALAGWQSFKASSVKTAATQTAAQTETRFSSSGETSASFDDWLSELATLLEAECDMRGIDP
jgi:hypothetical protein